MLPELEAHYQLLLKWNQKLNLTSEESLERHYGESLFLAEHLPAGRSGLSISVRGGLSRFPVAVVRPECEVTLIESHQRKAVFLKEASRKPPNIRVLAKRAEDVAGAVRLGDFARRQLSGSWPKSCRGWRRTPRS